MGKRTTYEWPPCVCGKPSEHRILFVLPNGSTAELYLCDVDYYGEGNT